MTSHPTGAGPISAMTPSTSATPRPTSNSPVTRVNYGGSFGGFGGFGAGTGPSYPCFATCMGVVSGKGGCGDSANPDYDCICRGDDFDVCLSSRCGDSSGLQNARIALRKFCGDSQANTKPRIVTISAISTISTVAQIPALPPSQLPSNDIGDTSNNTVNKEPKLNTGVILGIVVGGIALVIIAIGALIIKRHRNDPMRQNAKIGWHRNKRYTIHRFDPTSPVSQLSTGSVVGYPQSPLSSPYILTGKHSHSTLPSTYSVAQVGDQRRLSTPRSKAASPRLPPNETPRSLAIQVESENQRTEDPPPIYTIFDYP